MKYIFESLQKDKDKGEYLWAVEKEFIDPVEANDYIQKECFNNWYAIIHEIKEDEIIIRMDMKI